MWLGKWFGDTTSTYAKRCTGNQKTWPARDAEAPAVTFICCGGVYGEYVTIRQDGTSPLILGEAYLLTM